MTEPRPCAVCGKAQTPEFRPFCSRHCADVDLGRWFSGRYAVAAVEDEGAEAEDEND